MNNFLKIILLILPMLCFSQEYSTLPEYNITTSPSQEASLYFQQKRYNLFLNEIQSISNPSDEIMLSKAIALYHQGETNNSEKIFLTLTNNTNLEIKHQALLYLYQNSFLRKNYTTAKNYLQEIHKAPLDSPYKELAHVKLLHLEYSQQNNKTAQVLSESFELLYPDSPFIDDVQYFIALNSISLDQIKKAKYYATTILEKRTNLKIQRLLGEIAIKENDPKEALKYFLPIAESYNPYQDEGLFKSALLYKDLQDYTQSHKLFNILLDYHQNSEYAPRARAELAYVNILLKNYDDALLYYLKESNSTGTQQAFALLKITEIHFLKSNTMTVLRTADRLQKAFPYSAYANESMYWVGRAYLLEKDYQKSIDIFDDYLIREPQSQKKDEILIFLGHSHANLGNQSKARSYFQEIVNTSPNNQLKRQALLALGRSYSANEGARSLDFFDRVWKVWSDSPESEQALYYSAAIRYNLRNNKESLNLFKKLIQEFPESKYYPDAVLAMTKLEFKSENFKNIIDTDNIILTKNNREQVSEFKELQARSFFRVAQYEDALPLYQEASKLTTNKTRLTDLFLAEASTLRALGRHKEAVQNYEQYLKAMDKLDNINHLEELLWTEIVFSYLELQDTSKAKDTIAHIEEYYPTSKYLSEIYFKLADEYFAKNQYKNSSQYYEQTRLTTTDKSNQAEALLREAWSRSYSNDPKSQEVFELFIKQYPKHDGVVDISLRLANLYEKQKNTKHEELRHIIVHNFPDSLEAEETRLYFARQLTKNHTIDQYYEALSKTKDKGLRAKYLYKLGFKLKDENQIEEAIQIFKDVHTLKDPIHGADALFEAGDLLKTQKKYQESLQLYINVIAQYNEEYYPKSLDRIIQTYILLDDQTNADKFRDRLISQYPNAQESKKYTL